MNCTFCRMRSDQVNCMKLQKRLSLTWKRTWAPSRRESLMPAVEHPESLHVSGCFSVKEVGLSHNVALNTAMNEERYRNVLREQLLPTIQLLGCTVWHMGNRRVPNDSTSSERVHEWQLPVVHSSANNRPIFVKTAHQEQRSDDLHAVSCWLIKGWKSNFPSGGTWTDAKRHRKMWRSNVTFLYSDKL